jgi:disulfide bond formation protein DsbB
MSLHLYSTILVVGSMLIAGYALGALVLYTISKKWRGKLRSIDYRIYLLLIADIALISSVAAVVYQYVYLTPVCELCWWQRIVLFPLPLVALVGAYYKEVSTHITIAAMSFVGFLLAVYHYHDHVLTFVFKQVSTLPCAATGLTPACSESPILVFGFMTIPGMGVLGFLAILILCFFAQSAQKHQEHRAH